MYLWLEFILCSLFIVICGANLSRYGDIIAEKTGAGRAWIGVILMATITSLPELITGISSVTIADVPDITLGDIMGSCVYNLAIIGIMDIQNGRKSVFKKANKSLILSSSLGMILIAMSIFSIMQNGAIPSIGHVGLYTPLIFVIYFFGMREIYLFEKGNKIGGGDGSQEVLNYLEVSTKKTYAMYSLNAGVIIAAATLLPIVAGRLAKTTGLGETFMGSIFVAMTTSFPELVVSISAVRMGANDMAIGNMLGSNMFNIMILAVDDLFYTKGAIFSHISINHVTTGLIAIIMMAIVVTGIISPPKKKRFIRLGWGTLSLVILWFINIYLLYLAQV